MKTLEYSGNCSIHLGEKPVPEPASDQVRIKVSYAGICGTDMHIADGQHPRAKGGLVMGHEFSGTIDKAGVDTDFSVGERVVVEPLISCGSCYSCRSGYPHVCQNLGLYGIDADGAFAEYVVIASDKVYRLPDSIQMVHGALVEPMAVGVHAIRLSNLKSLDTVLVIGGGPIGLFVAIAAKQAGADVFISEINPFRNTLLKRLGFKTFDTNSEPSVRDEITDGKGFDVVFDAAGGPETLKIANVNVRVKGQVVMVAIPTQDRAVSYVPISFKEISLIGVRVYEYYDFHRAIHMLENLDMDLSLLYQVYPLESYEEAFASAKGGDDVMRVLFDLEGADV